MACSWSKQPIWQGTGSNYLNSVNDATIGGQITTVPNAYASQTNQTLPGDHVVLDEAAANAAGNPAFAQLHGGYFQYVGLDPVIAGIGAVSTTFTVTAAGSGYAQATTTVSFTAAPAGGVTAQGVPVISASGTLLDIFMTTQGSGYTVAPTVTITGAGTSAAATATIQAASPLIAGQALYWKLNGTTPAGVYTVTNIIGKNNYNLAGVLLNPSWTPGNYSWIQNLGRATALIDAASTPAITPGTGIYLSAATGTSNSSFTSATTGAALTYVGVAEGYVAATPTAGTTTLIDIQKVSLRF